MDVIDIVLAVVLLFLIFLSGFFSGSENAFTTLSQEKWSVYKNNHKPSFSTKAIDVLLSNYSMMLSAVLIGNNLVNIGATTISTVLFQSLLGRANLDNGSILIITTVIMTVIVIIFGEFLPKNFAKKNPLKFALMTGSLLYIFFIIFWPLSYLLTFLSKTKSEEKRTELEISHLIDIAEDEKIFEISEAELIKNAMKFDEKNVEQVMKKNPTYINLKTTPEEILKTFEITRYSRIPVLKEKKIVGTINIKQFLLTYIEKEKDKEMIDVEKHLDQALFTTKTEKLDSLLRKIKIAKKHMAIVVDNINNKKMIGIVTLEDLLEEIVGEIYDEQDIIINDIEDFTTNSWLVKPKTNAHTFFKEHFGEFSENIDKKITLSQFMQKEFNVKKINTGQSYENELFVINVIQDPTTRKWALEIIKK